MLWPHSPVLAFGLLMLSHALVLYPTLNPNAQWLGPVITSFATTRKEVWLTIDDGPADDTLAVLELFASRGVLATFFVKGTLTETNADLAREIVRRGHSLANHSHTHPSGSFWCQPPGRIASEIDGCNRAIEKITGKPTRWFRAPVGMKNPFVHPALRRRDMRLIGWTSRGFDAVASDPDAIVARILPTIRPGAIVLLHQGSAHSVATLARVIDALRGEDYSFVIPDDAALRNTNR